MSTQLADSLQVAAQLGALGLDPMRFLYTKDDDERNLMIEMGRRMYELRQKMDENLSVMIANNVGKLFK